MVNTDPLSFSELVRSLADWSCYYMKLAITIHKTKSMQGRIKGYKAEFREVCTDMLPTIAEAEARLLQLVEANCTRQEPKVAIAAGHVGVLSRDLYGMVSLQHVWPDGHTSCSFGGREMNDSADDFYLHVAQCEWKGASAEFPSYLPVSRQSEYRYWVEWQLKYEAGIAQGLTDNDAHRYASGMLVTA
jgi:hypothetical protein